MCLSRIISCFLLVATCLIGSHTSYAGIQALATRVVYEGDAKAATLSINNNSTLPYMVQVWLEDPNNPKSLARLPIIVIPPLLKLEPERETVLRFIYAGQGLPNDKETLYWVNIQEIPPSSQDQNTLQIAVKTRLKLFYRPKGVTMRLHEAAKSLRWSLVNGELKVFNPTALHVTIGTLQLDGKGEKLSKLNKDMVGPDESITVLKKVASSVSAVSFTYINDYGGESAISLQTINK